MSRSMIGCGCQGKYSTLEPALEKGNGQQDFDNKSYIGPQIGEMQGHTYDWENRTDNGAALVRQPHNFTKKKTMRQMVFGKNSKWAGNAFGEAGQKPDEKPKLTPSEERRL